MPLDPFLPPPPPHDIDAALVTLDLEGEDGAPDLAWLEKSWAEPEPFAEGLAAYLARNTGPQAPRSRIGEHYDLYHDLVARHAVTDRVALRAWDARGGEETLGYAALHAAAGAWASAWVARGAAPGDRVCLLLPLGVDFLVALGAALRLGLCVSVLPPDAPGYAERRLAALAPRFVAVDPRLEPPKLPEGVTILPRGDRERPPASPPFTYRPEAACAQIFSPLRSPTERPVTLGAADAYLGALGDGVFAYRLSPADPLAAIEEGPIQPVIAGPGIHREQHFPSVLLATLLLGATFLHVPYDALEKAPQRIAEKRVRALLLTPRARDVLRGVPLPLLTLWLRDAGEPLDWTAWRAFVLAQKRKDGGEPLTANVLVDAAAGGCLLFSPTRPGSLSARVLPVPGRPFSLIDVASGEPSPAGHGIFIRRPVKTAPPVPAAPAPLGFFVLARQGAEYLQGGGVVPRRAARVYPRAEVAAAVPLDAPVRGAAVVAVPSTRAPGDNLFILLVFIGGATLADQAAAQLSEGCRAALRANADPKLCEACRAAALAAAEEKLREACRVAVVKRVGEPLAPDRVELVPLHPRRSADTGAVDLDWCQRQYATGALARKARDPVYRALTALRDTLSAPAA